MSKYRYVEGMPPEGTLTLGVVYHITRERDIADSFMGRVPDYTSPPPAIGYVVVDEDEKKERKFASIWEKTFCED